MRRSDVSRLDVGVVALRCEVLEQLDHVVAAGNAEVRHAHVRVGVADDRREVAALLLLRREHLAAERVAVERERAVEVRDRVAGVMEPADRHRASARSLRSSTPPSGATTNTFSTPRAVDPGEVDARLDGDHHPGLERRVVGRDQVRILERPEAEPVTGVMRELASRERLDDARVHVLEDARACRARHEHGASLFQHVEKQSPGSRRPRRSTPTACVSAVSPQ